MATQTKKGEGELSTENLAALLDLMADADSAELKVTLPEAEHRPAIAALGLDRSMDRSGRSTSSTHPISSCDSTVSPCGRAGSRGGAETPS
jgi:hypothetical protein